MKLKRYAKYHYLKMLRLKDTPAKVAEGVALGVAMDFVIPIPLVSIFIAFLVARIFKMNSLAAVMSATAFKPLFAGIVGLNILTTGYIIKAFPNLKGVALPHPAGISHLERLLNSILSQGVPYLIACAVNGVIIGIIVYVVVLRILQYRRNRLKKKRIH